ncbi:MAG: DUF86 domain-containing protein [Chloroflexi bacterium]|nr:DUF86 domain-containing protein [Chloroflexota bacterium]
MVNLDTIEGIFRNLDTYVANLRALAQLPSAELLNDAARLGGAKYYLHTAVECCVDVANHMIARQNWRAPQSLADSFVVLAEHGVISADFLATARQMVGMRNRLVHLYWDMDAETVYDTLQDHLGDFEHFKAAIYVYLQTTGLIDPASQ